MKVDVRNDVSLGLTPLQPLREVRIQIPQFSQQSAAEEVGMLFSQKVESTSKTRSEQEVRSIQANTRVQRVEGIKQLAELYEQLGHPGQVRLEHLAQQVRQELLFNPSVERLLNVTAGDPARTDVVLQYLTAQAQAQERHQEAERSSRFQEQFQERYALQIQAAKNIARTLTASGDASMRQAIRTLYYTSVVVNQSLVMLVQALLGLCGEKGFGSGLNTLSRALADDIAAQRSSRPTHQLRTLLIGLNSCGQLGRMLSSCRGFVERSPIRERDVEQACVTLLQRLLGYANTGLDDEECHRLSQELSGHDISHQLSSLNRVYHMLQRLPLAVWGDSKNREETLQQLLKVLGERTRVECKGLPLSRLTSPLQ